MAKSLEDVLDEVSKELDRLGKVGLGTSLPQYVSYDGLRVVESKGGDEPTQGNVQEQVA